MNRKTLFTLWLVCASAPAFAQSTATPAAPPLLWERPPDAPSSSPPLLPPAAPADPLLPHRAFAAQLQFGFPAGLRLQLAPHRGADRYTAWELFAGSEWTVGVAMLGVRHVFQMPHRDPTTAFFVGPGIHMVYFNTLRSGGDTNGGGLLVDALFGWAIDRDRGVSWEVGFNLGLGLFAIDRAFFPLPTFGFFAGCRF